MCIYEAHQCSGCNGTQPVLYSACRIGIVHGPHACNDQQIQGMQRPHGFRCRICSQPPRPSGIDQLNEIVSKLRVSESDAERRLRLSHDRFVALRGRIDPGTTRSVWPSTPAPSANNAGPAIRLPSGSPPKWFGSHSENRHSMYGSSSANSQGFTQRPANTTGQNTQTTGKTPHSYIVFSSPLRHGYVY
ncbi:hypothetical protein BROUX41_001391 [Berkeleyomyces rouxiae]|uniref:uncharacterized protein n=1 Tax=Berkeleyomyces rouxiae TaxID=2035830 RepID=UPI003B761A89